MSIPKIKGFETEWSITLKAGNDYRPAAVADFKRMIDVVNGFFNLSADSQNKSLGEIENIGRARDLDSLMEDSSLLSLLHPHCHNLLPNGARLYIDGPHLEYSTAECLSAKTLVAADRAGEVIVSLARNSINDALAGSGQELIVRKDNCDRNGHSYGCHVNYLVARKTFDKIVDKSSLELGYLASFLTWFLIFTGSGKMGVEADGKRLEEAVYQISQRADFTKRLLSLCTIDERAIVNTRDEPMADSKIFARLHLIMCDANLAEIANYMKAGIPSIILKMLEDGFLKGDIIIGDPVNGIKMASRDLTCKKPVLETLSGRRLSSLDLSEEYFQRARDYYSTVCQPSPEEIDLMRLWEESNSDFRAANEARLRRRYDWKLKQGILDYFLQVHGIPWEHIGTARIKRGLHSYRVVDELFNKDINYHDLDKERGLYWDYKEAGDVERVVSKEDVKNLVENPPTECRSYFRGRCIGKFFRDIEEADWHRILFKANGRSEPRKNFLVSFSPFEGIEMLNPIWGGKNDTGEILDRSATCADLFRELRNFE